MKGLLVLLLTSLTTLIPTSGYVVSTFVNAINDYTLTLIFFAILHLSFASYGLSRSSSSLFGGRFQRLVVQMVVDSSPVTL